MVKNKDRLLIQILCVIAALITWLYVIDQMNPVTEKEIDSVPVILQNTEKLEIAGLVVADVDTDEISLVVEGFRNDIINLETNDINVYVDVNGYNEGLNKIPLEIQLPDDYKLIDYSPKQVLCELEAIVNKSIDLTVEIDGIQISGYYVDDAVSSVNSVIVRGPRSVLNSAEKAVALFNINGASGTLEKKVPIDVYSDQGLELDLEITPDIANITVPVYPMKRLKIVVPVTGLVMDGYDVKEIKVEPETVLIAGKPGIIDSMDHVLVEPVSIDEADSTVFRSLDIIEGNYIIAEKILPVATVVVEKIISKDFIYNLDEIEFINVPDGYNLEITDDKEFVLATLTGLTSYMNETGRNDLKIVADLEGFEGVSGRVVLKYETQKEIREIELDAESIEIKLVKNEGNTEGNDTEDTNTEESNT
ncbi:YbbR domain-containing protein [Dethiosulfatibacter aminovorans DSM 17477]|uniref:YbbR domain-containing protein n=1 Tax=Dethiosulfatibacter aminovorans DSM 17477 TaxID=1121476 RepID=A0A1M6H638_9FIRM|nr:CdaR family protein [Dethiosulfatibacter aminovorans]SHJ17651.1 YbbR domain-containing protein [Dethiosulfatibacter aminovorans DSM 17477]